MRKIISNSTPIISLAILGKLPLLAELFDVVYVPEAVYKEVVHTNTTKHYGKKELEQLVHEGKIHSIQVENKQLISTLYGKLHEGELEVIVGAKELGLETVLMDERAARSFAKTFLLRPIGTIGILLLAKKEGKVKQVKPLLDKLISEGVFLSKNLYYQALEEADE
ncbi:DUF3368 domain-containing protein [Siminovitchia sp. 179-K 8D1 HS]|uniref:DUF3368 domain-containing protein n=1 Tax=Siminovitchia sp. 179-K 8D1 HS TaxID=3142385 RepID=UPI0039A1E3F3